MYHLLIYETYSLNFTFIILRLCLRSFFQLWNSGTPTELNYTSLNIQVTDVDDMDPVFDHDEYYLNITEGVGTLISQNSFIYINTKSQNLHTTNIS